MSLGVQITFEYANESFGFFRRRLNEQLADLFRNRRIYTDRQLL